MATSPKVQDPAPPDEIVASGRCPRLAWATIAPPTTNPEVPMRKWVPLVLARALLPVCAASLVA